MAGTLTPIPRPTSTSPSSGGIRPLSPFKQMARQSHASVQTWISHLATSPNLPPMSSTPKPIPVTLPTTAPGDSPGSTTKDMDDSDHAHQLLGGENEKGYESVVKLPVPAWPGNDEKASDGTGDIPHIPTEPASPGSRKSRASRFVGGFVGSLRSIPRAMTHSSVYDRRTTESGKYSYRTDSQVLDGPAGGVPHPGMWYRVPPPPLASLEHRQPHTHGPMPIPILLAHPPPHARGMLPRYEPPLSTIGSEYYSKQDDGSSNSGSISSRLGEFWSELSSMPWIAPGRVAVDYLPGETQRARLQRSGSNGSWYSINPPSSPSDISNLTKYVAEPWFPSTQLPPTQEVDEREHEESAGRERGLRSEGNEPVEEQLKQVQEELQEKVRELDSMRQVVEYQKKHIGSLEAEIARLREEQETHNDIRRWRSGTRKSLSYRKRDSVRTVTSVRRTSMSRPPSTFIEE